MKKLLFIMSLAMVFAIGCQKEDDEIIVDDNNEEAVLSAQEVLDLQFLIEEEKLARDVYLFSNNLYNNNVFNNIANSEQSHMDRIEGLLVTYNIANPIAGKAEGEFVNQDLQALYNDLTATSEKSILDAFIIGATIEDLDISDIDHLIANTDKDDLLSAYDNLTCGSRNHLRNYYKNVVSNGGEYVPQFIDQALFENIINSENEKCGQQ